jgi:enamine deaminase RidA (YjgF/YER057c/UK114 family)
MKTLKLQTILMILFCFSLLSCVETEQTSTENTTTEAIEKASIDKPQYFQLRPEVEQAYGYTHAVKIGNHIKISGAVSMDDNGNPIAIGDIEQQMKNCYADLEKILKHFNCTFDDVVKEDVFTTDMAKFLEVSGFRAEVYNGRFPTGSWLGVKELALPELLIEIELEVYHENN